MSDYIVLKLYFDKGDETEKKLIETIQSLPSNERSRRIKSLLIEEFLERKSEVERRTDTDVILKKLEKIENLLNGLITPQGPESRRPRIGLIEEAEEIADDPRNIGDYELREV
ncbi:MAG: hypothetical protein ACUVXI_05005 [bacterium]